MNEKINELYKKVNVLMQASGNFDVGQFEQVKQELEQLLGKELDDADEKKMEHGLAENAQKAILKALDGQPSLEMISIVDQIVSQAGGEYKAIKSKYMHDAVDLFIEYLNDIKISEKQEDASGK